MAQAAVKAISTYLPERVLDNAELVRQFGTWTESKIFNKTGISSRHVVEDETVSDLAVGAGERFFEEYGMSRGDIDFLLLCTECPDYFLPATACVVQDRLGLRKSTGALDFNLGCSGYVYGLALARGLVSGGLAKNVLLITADTISRTVHPKDKSTRTLFGDAAAATLVASSEGPGIGEFVLGTDGSGADRLIIPAGAWACRSSAKTQAETVNRWGNMRTSENLYMDGPSILKFALDVVPCCMDEVLKKNGATKDGVDLFVFHQASRMLLEKLRETLGIPEEKFVFNIENYGNTASCTIPLALHDIRRDGRLTEGKTVLILGFGVGLSWGGTLLRF